MRILAVDPGLTRCGIGVVDVDRNRRTAFAGVTVLRTDPAADLALRLLDLDRQVHAVLDEFRPDVVAVERVFSQHNVRTAMGTAQASAVAILAAAQRGLTAYSYTPTEVKAAVTGYGRADKQQVTTMVTRLLRLTEPPRPADAADALALALCHAMKGMTAHALAGAR